VLIEALAQRRPPSGAPDQIGLDTSVMALVDQHLVRLAEDGRAPADSSDVQGCGWKLRNKLSGVRLVEATPARINAALRR
jgi:hypothetical protein